MRTFLRPSLLLFVLPMLGSQCDGQEYTWDNQQYIWARANTTVSEDSIVVVRGRVLETVELNEQRLFLVESACESYSDWPQNMECLESRITLLLEEGIEYDIVGWSEPQDRRNPSADRVMITLREAWTCCD